MFLLFVAFRCIIRRPPSFDVEPRFRIKQKDQKPQENKINWGKIWKGIKTAFKVVTTVIKIVSIFLDEEENVLYINGYKVTDVVAGEDGRPKQVTLENGVNKIVIGADIKELAIGQFSWAKFWEGIQKLLEYISKLFQSEDLVLEDDAVTLGDYEITDVTLNENDVAEDITLENPSGNKISFHIEIGATNEEEKTIKRPRPHHITWRKIAHKLFHKRK
ncbi:hypothetical protein GPJ56_001870 [Histomonas meleagridis]|uniref:uncharacterized protein n=1 Tax=Histomonas meleagridis TaxID=135588 RepID=UPI00355A08F6|nr:hypothetical protein GPJ56_001870 [Histomonas meleagridis]KAH0803191.1 hypothetical protein GO595_003927 [Histomonas meleagridis]